ncbi:hypothetical protein QBC38DRAFT_481547 [Podospora fimiseda]|uniref:Rhodopsin domain-containing protein n=1 Tax=Podospora fimiseda TaxID=252190 RepID=A0AAN7BMK5_9PEZI|nr:hypothetical protein QBC38DRAFT_481547 [Podospora fimiseda]
MSVIDYGNDTDPLSSANIINQLIVISAVAPALALVFVSARFYTARSVLRTIHKDDWLILPAMVTAIVFSIFIIVMTKYGLGQRLGYLGKHGLWKPIGKKFVLLSGFGAALTSNVATLFTKCSILVFYLRFSTSRYFTWTIYTILGIVIVANTLGALHAFFVCQPMKRFWTGPGTPGTCWDQHAWYAWLIIMNCVTDGILLVLPAWILAPLRVGLSQKVGIAAILGTGGFVVGVSILRVVIMETTKEMEDMTYRFAINYFWTTVEMNVAIVCACAPCLRPLLAQYFPSLVSLGAPRREPASLYTLPVSQVVARPSPRTDQVDTSESTMELTSNCQTFGSPPRSSTHKEAPV